MNILETIKFKLTGRSVPVFRVSEMNWVGRIATLTQVGKCKDMPNSILDTYNGKLWEKENDTVPITFIDTKGIPTQAWVVTEDGATVNLYTKPVDFPKREEVLGQLALMDIAGQILNMGNSMRDKIIFLVVGVFLGWWIVGPMFGAMLS